MLPQLTNFHSLAMSELILYRAKPIFVTPKILRFEKNPLVIVCQSYQEASRLFCASLQLN